ncbi:hypothetical protein ACOCEA_07070 [Maribacter sp. CXY002]|uniref:hypothetical protein n=1 Tax=Maribacter luteocoastalis TaxID=3407671 RepID=UPI003B66E673
MDQYLIKYLVENSDNPLSKKYIDFFKAELDWHLYISETHIAKSYHRNAEIPIKDRSKRFYQYVTALFLNHGIKQSNKLNILSTLKLSQQQTSFLSDLGFDSYSPIWHPLRKNKIYGDYKTLKWHKNIQHRIRTADFHTFLKSEFHQELEIFQEHLITQYQRQDFKALLLYTDQYFYSKYAIDIFKKLNRPSFVFSHGMPGGYTLAVDNRADYLMVWSEKIKANYINAGFDADKVKVVGNPHYKNIEKHKVLRSDLSDILIIPVSSVTWHQHAYDNIVTNDSSLVVLYLYKVQAVLQKLGVKKARYRTHPSLNKGWVHPMVDQDFYSMDTEPLITSLSRSSLVIGAVSTVLLESIMNGVNYIGFDPKKESGLNFAGYTSAPPFDGSDEKLILTDNEEDLEAALKANAITDYGLVHDYMQDLDLTVLKELIMA